MKNLLKAFLYKISKDITLRITLIIGAGLAVFMTALFAFIQYGLLSFDDMEETGETIKFISGQGMFLTSISPAQNYGLAIPINLVSFICLEFSQGTIRNKIIAGHSKFKIYASLFISGLIFCFVLLGTYVLICTGLGAIFGGFNFDDVVFGLMGAAKITPEYFIKMIIIAIVTYICIVSFTVFMATTLRSIGPCIPVIIVPIVILYLAGTMSSVFAMTPEDFDYQPFLNVLRVIDPLYAVSTIETTESGLAQMENLTFIGAICSNLIYATLFFIGGSLLFKNRDVK